MLKGLLGKSGAGENAPFKLPSGRLLEVSSAFCRGPDAKTLFKAF